MGKKSKRGFTNTNTPIPMQQAQMIKLAQAKMASAKKLGAKKQTVCLNMIVKNESHVIEQCLESIVHLVDYYVINDTGSTDDTREKIKAFFDARGIKGEIIDHEFRTCTCHGGEYKKYKFFHFGWNRSYALEKCRRKSDYIMFMDADDTVEGDLKFPPTLVGDQYLLNVRTDFNVYLKPLLIKNDPKLNFHWEDGLHEYLTGDVKMSMTLVGDYYVLSRRLGARNQDPLKYYNDAAVLEELLLEFPDNIRYKYYLAQSWFDAREFQKAIDAYEHVISSCDDLDRIYSCQYMIGRAHILKGSPIETIERVFWECYKQHKHRAEPLFQLCALFSERGEYQKAYDYGMRVIDLPFPRNTAFYIDKTVYDYRLLDEMVFCASQIGRYREALKWSEQLLKDRKYPPDSHQHVLANIFSLKGLVEKEMVEGSKRRAAQIQQVNADKPCLCFYVGPSPMFDKERFGSELAVMYLARELAKDYNVFIAGERCDGQQEKDIWFLHSDELHMGTCTGNGKRKPFDVMIVSRYVNYFVEYDVKRLAKRTYVWLHDIDFHPYWNEMHLPGNGLALVRNVDGLVDGYVALSPWHKEHLMGKYGLCEDKINVIGNGISAECLDAEWNGVKKVPGKFLWVSQHDRGLYELAAQFHRIVRHIPNAHLDVYRKVSDDVKKVLEAMPFVNLKGQATNKEILHAFAEAEYWYYPTKWSETYCISALEAQAMGCVCICSDLAALSTTVGERGTLLKKPIYTEEFWNEGLDALLKYEGDEALKERVKQAGREWARGQVWGEVAKRWLELFSHDDGGIGSRDMKSLNMFERLRVLKKFGFDPAIVLDIGANVGQWNCGFKAIFPKSRVISFEANPECYQTLREKGIELCEGLLGSGDVDEVDFYFTKGDGPTATGASMFREKTSFYGDDVVVSCKVPVKRLDDVVLGGEGIGGLDEIASISLIKIDVQGAELEVLKGGLKCLARTDFVLLEVSVMRYNEGAPLFAEVVRFMDEHGFAMFDIVENHYINDCFMQVDALFLRRGSRWTKKIAETNAAKTFWKVDDIYA